MRRLLPFALLMVTLSSPALTHSSGAVFGTRGLRAVALNVPIWGDTPRSLHDELLPRLASTLRDTGATVLLPGDPGFNDMKNQLMVSLKLYKSSDAVQCAWGVDIELYEPIVLERDRSIHPSRAYAYHNWRMGIVPCKDVEDVLRNNAVEFFGQFASAYKSENSRK